MNAPASFAKGEGAVALDRRQFIAGTAAAAGVAALPAAAIAAPLLEAPAFGWAAGTEGEFNWRAFSLATEADVRKAWLVDRCGSFTCEETEGEPRAECDCEVCYDARALEIRRIEDWDGKEEIKAGDWLRVGLGHVCSRCDYETFAEDGGHAVGDEAVCDECMTLADWDVVDPEHAAELRAEADEG